MAEVLLIKSPNFRYYFYQESLNKRFPVFKEKNAGLNQIIDLLDKKIIDERKGLKLLYQVYDSVFHSLQKNTNEKIEKDLETAMNFKSIKGLLIEEIKKQEKEELKSIILNNYKIHNKKIPIPA